jgi:hypothetical protein
MLLILGDEVSKKEWIAIHNGCTIQVTNTWTGGAKLYIDGDCRDTSNDMFAKSDSPTLTARVVPTSGEPYLVEVYMKSITTVKAKICVNGGQIGGDVF